MNITKIPGDPELLCFKRQGTGALLSSSELIVIMLQRMGSSEAFEQNQNLLGRLVVICPRRNNFKRIQNSNLQ